MKYLFLLSVSTRLKAPSPPPKKKRKKRKPGLKGTQDFSLTSIMKFTYFTEAATEPLAGVQRKKGY